MLAATVATSLSSPSVKAKSTDALESNRTEHVVAGQDRDAKQDWAGTASAVWTRGVPSSSVRSRRGLTRPNQLRK